MKGRAPVGLVLDGLPPGVRVDAKRSQGCNYGGLKVFLVASMGTLSFLSLLAVYAIWTAVGLACELHGLPIVVGTASGWCKCWTGLLGQGPQCLESGPAT